MWYMKGVMKKFSEKIDFNNYYNDKILKRYEVFGDEKIFKGIVDFCGSSTEHDCVFIPNFVSVGYYFSIDWQTIYLISAAKIRNGISEYYTKHIISNSIHEFFSLLFYEVRKWER